MSDATPLLTLPAVEIRGLSTRFGETVIHRDLDLDLETGQMLGLVGGSGSGKDEHGDGLVQRPAEENKRHLLFFRHNAPH